jgi:hypothetical protein
VCVERKVGLGKNIKPPPGVFFIFLSFSPAKKKVPSTHTTSSFHFWFVRDEGTSRNNNNNNPDMHN